MITPALQDLRPQPCTVISSNTADGSAIPITNLAS